MFVFIDICSTYLVVRFDELGSLLPVQVSEDDLLEGRLGLRRESEIGYKMEQS